MKHLLLLVLLIFVTACSSKKEGNMTVNGQIEGLKKGTLYLQKMNDTTLVSVDSISLLGTDQFTLTDNVASPQVYYLTFDTNTSEKRIMFFGEQGTITITDKLEKFGINPKISGSKNQLVLEDYFTMRSQFQGKRLDLLKVGFEAQKEDNIELQDSIQKASENLLKRQYLYTTNFALSKSDTDAAAYIALSELTNANVKLLDTVYTSLSENVKNSLYGKKLNRFIKNIKENETKD